MTSHKPTLGVADAAWTAQERELLGAAREERMPSHLEARLREALEMQLGAATISGVHGARDADDVVRPASSQQHDAPSLAGPPMSALDRSARLSQMFATKLPLWGVLCAVALGTFAYIGQRHPAPQANSPGLQLSAADAAAIARASGTIESTSAQTSTWRDGVGDAAAVTAADSEAATDPALKLTRGAGAAADIREGQQAAREPNPRGPAAPRTSSAAESGNGRARGASRETEASNKTNAAASGGGRARGLAREAEPSSIANAAASGAAASRVGNAAESGGGVLGASRDVADARDSRAAVSGSGRARGSLREAGSAPAAVGGEGRSLPAPGGVDAPVRAPSSADALRLEAELLDGARRALSRGALQEARLFLGRYSARFARGVLQPESDVLGIELEMRTGAERAAQSHAARFLASYPHHPLRERVRELVVSRAVTAVE
ncbi:MAG TPA: hypothetical protein VFN67_20640 [Polyangiales bacterium]|nr:hypothetical protein [Polyangiales bacterium]